MHKKYILIGLSLLLVLATSLAQTSAPDLRSNIVGLDIGQADSKLVFGIKRSLFDGQTYTAVFAADLASGQLLPLTVYPEKFITVNANRAIVGQVNAKFFIQNAFGLYALDPLATLPHPQGQLSDGRVAIGADAPQVSPALLAVKGYPSFAEGANIVEGQLPNLSIAPGGAYVTYTVTSNTGQSDLMLIDMSTGQASTIAKNINISPHGLIAQWSPDAQVLIYAKDGWLYYFSLADFRYHRTQAESARRILKATLNACQWAVDNKLYIARGQNIVRIASSQFLTTTTNELELENLQHVLPSSFDNALDRFWLSPDAQYLLYEKSDSSFFWLDLHSNTSDTDDKNYNNYLRLKKNETVQVVLWPQSEIASIITKDDNTGFLRAYRMQLASSVPPVVTEEDSSTDGEDASTSEQQSDNATTSVTPTTDTTTSDEPGDSTTVIKKTVTVTEETSTELSGNPLVITQLQLPDSYALSLSPSGHTVAIATKTGITLKNYYDWNDQQTELPLNEAVNNVTWLDDSNLILSNGTSTSLRNILNPQLQVLALSSADSFGHDMDGNILIKTGTHVYSSPPLYNFLYNQVIHWTPLDPSASMRAPITGYNNYRVYLDTAPAGSPFVKTVIVNKVDELGTSYDLFAKTAGRFAVNNKKNSVTPSAIDGVFNHGARLQNRQIALTLDLVDDSAGLKKILQILKSYNLTITIFVSGEFLKRNPDDAALLAASPHEIASLGMSNLAPRTNDTLNDPFYYRRELAKNEELWFGLSGRALRRYWHSPNYFVNAAMREASAKNGYQLIGREFDPLDWVSKEKASASAPYLSSSQIIERILGNVQAGSIIPLRLSEQSLERSDRVTDKLTQLINALRNKGYSITTVSTLLNSAPLNSDDLINGSEKPEVSSYR